MKRMKWKRLMRQGLAVSLALAMCISTGPITAFAEADEVAEKTSTVNEDPKPENQKTDETESVGIKDGKAEADETKSGETKSDETASDETKTDEETSDDSESSDGPAGAPENNTEDKQNGGAETKEHTHDWDDGAVTEEATCSKAGVKTYTCKAEDCKETKTEELPLTEHLDEDNNDICDVCEECLAETDSETVRTFLAAVEALKKQEAKEDADEEELEKMLADFRASYESAKALYDGLTDGQKMLEEITAAYGDLTDIGAGLELMTLEAADSVSGDMTGSSFLEKAVDGVITLDGNVTITDNVVWVQNTLALDLNGHTIYGRVACYIGNLTIRDSVGTGQVITKGNQGSTLLNNGEDGTTSLTVEGGTFIAPQGCNSLYNMNGAAADIKGGTFGNGVGNGWWDGDKANEGGGVINITGGVLKTQEFSDGTSTVCIPAITNAAEVNISGGAAIQSENSACVIENYGTMNINGGLVKAKEKNFGVIGNYNDGTINIRGGEFVGAIDNWFIAEETKPVKIYGGTFSFPVEYTDKMTSYLIDGLMFDPYGKVVEDQNTQYVARINDQGYASLQDAVNAAENGDTVTLLKNVVMDNTPANKHISITGKLTIDLNGHNIERGTNNTGYCLINSNGGDLTIEGSGTIDGAATFVNGSNTYIGEGIRASNNGKITIKSNVVIKGGYAVRLYKGCSAVIEDNANIQGTTHGILGSGVAASIQIDGGTVSATNATAIQAQLGANVTVNGGIVTSPKIAINGLTDDKNTMGTITINGGIVESASYNESNPQNFGAVVANSYHVVMTGGELKGPYTISMSTYNGNDSAKTSGTSTLVMTGGAINSTIQAVGVNNLKSAGVTAEISGGTITAPDNRTAIYWPAEGMLTIKGNASISGGTGIEMKMGTLNIEGGTITGSGIYATAEPVNGGAGPEGSALLVSTQMYDAYVENPDLKVNITSGSLISRNGNAVTVYNTMRKDVPAVINISGGKMTGTDGKNAFYVFTAENTGVTNRTTYSISGGTFSTPVPAEYCAEGFEPVSNGDNTYSVKSSKPDDTGNTGGTTGGNTSGDNTPGSGTTGGSTSGDSTPGSGTTGGSNTDSTTGGSSSSSGGGSSSGSGSSSNDNTDDTSAPAAAPAPAVTVVTAPAATPAPAAAAPAAEDTPAAEENMAVDDEEVPLADGGEVKETEDEEEPETESESVILEDEETPLAAKPGRNWTLLSIIPAALAAAFIILILLRRKKEEEEEA